MSEEIDFKRITIIGCGLIGGSIGLSLKKNNYSGQIFGIDKKEVIEKAIDCQAIDQGSETMELGIADTDLIILATPVKEIIKLIREIIPCLSRPCLITDTGSTKTDIIRQAEIVLSNKCDFIGGHPMAGSEKSGIEYADPDLFIGKPYIVVPGNRISPLANRKMSSIINLIGAVEVQMDAGSHDRVVGLVSHLPQLIAVVMTNMLGSLVEEQDKKQYFRISGNVYNEMTRVACSPFSIWRDIYQTNSKWTIAFIEELENLLENIKQKIAENPDELEVEFTKANYYKEQMTKWALKNHNKLPNIK